MKNFKPEIVLAGLIAFEAWWGATKTELPVPHWAAALVTGVVVIGLAVVRAYQPSIKSKE